MVKYLPTMQERWVRSLGRGDPLEKEMAIHSNTFAWKIPWTEEPGGLQSMGSQRVRHDCVTNFLYYVFVVPFLALSLIFYKLSVTLFPFFVLVVYC